MMGDFEMFIVGVIGVLLIFGVFHFVNLTKEHDEQFNYAQKFCLDNGYDYAVDRGLAGGIDCIISHPQGFYARININDLNKLVIQDE
jgi:hypothetical protein